MIALPTVNLQAYNDFVNDDTYRRNFLGDFLGGKLNQPMTGTDIANQEFQQAAEQAKQQNLIEQASARKMAEEMDYRRNLVTAKAAYAKAARQGDVNGMAQAARQGEMIRQDALNRGIDTGGWGDNLNYDEALYQLGLDTQAQRRTLWDMGDPETYYANRTNELMQGGMGEYDARQQANREAMQYKADNLARAKFLMYDQGIDNGALNSLGMIADMNLLQYSPQQAAIPLASLALPKDTWRESANINQAQLTEELRERFEDLRNRHTIERDNNTANNTIAIDSNRSGLRRGEAQAAYELGEAAKDNAIQRQIGLAQFALKNPELGALIFGGAASGGGKGGKGSASPDQLKNAMDILGMAKDNPDIVNTEAYRRAQKLVESSFTPQSERNMAILNHMRGAIAHREAKGETISDEELLEATIYEMNLTPEEAELAEQILEKLREDEDGGGAQGTPGRSTTKGTRRPSSPSNAGSSNPYGVDSSTNPALTAANGGNAGQAVGDIIDAVAPNPEKFKQRQ